jgi:RNA recognition motif-containing protein
MFNEVKKMSKKLFVGGLSWGTTEEDLREAFEQFGEIQEVKIIVDRDSGRSRGFGFITFADPNEGDNAIKQMNGATLDGRQLRVNEANERGGGGGGRNGGGGGGERRGGGGGGERRGGGGGGGGRRGGGGGGGGYGGGGGRGGRQW